MNVTIGTFNLNNLFSRFNFKGEIDAIKSLETVLDGEVVYEFDASDTWKIRTYRGGLVRNKEPEEVSHIASRIREMDVDVLAIQLTVPRVVGWAMVKACGWILAAALALLLFSPLR